MTSNIFHAPADLRLGAVWLSVRQLGKMIDFYHGLLGLEVLSSERKQAVLGFEHDHPLIVLAQKAGDVDRPDNAAGLYHFALLTPMRARLAQALKRLVQTGYPLQGAADHFVSEAIYLADPEGNGIEIYADRPRDTWQWDGDRLRIGTVPLDVNSLLSVVPETEDPSSVLAAGTLMGHIHLQVSDLSEAKIFYEHNLGLDSMGDYGASAAFYSAGGYHHHIGLNTWASARGPKAEQGMLGLIGYELIFPGDQTLSALIDFLALRDIAFDQNDGRIRIEDPAGNQIFICTERTVSGPI